MSITKCRENTILEDSEKFASLYGINPLEGYNFKFMCYQSAYKHTLQDIFGNRNSTLVICDEIHEMLTPTRYQFVKNNLLDKSILVLGLSATIDGKTVYKSDEGDYKKTELLNTFAPICFRYTVAQGQEEETARKLEIYVIRHKLNRAKTILAGPKDKQFLTSEEANYEYLSREFKKSLFLPMSNKSRDFLIRNAASRRAKFLYNLPSKIEACKQLLKNIHGKTLIFGNSVDSLLEITPNVIAGKVSGYQDILSKFKDGKISVAGAFKILEQGENIPDLDNLVLLSYYGKTKAWIQRIGRLRKANHVGRVYVFLTEGTQEEVWFRNMIEDTAIQIKYLSIENNKISVL